MSAEPSESRREGEGAEPWFRRAFQADYLNLYAHRNQADAGRAARLIRERVDPQPGWRMLDLGCGAGRHLRTLAPMVGRAIGLDLSRVLLRRGRADLAEAAGAAAAPPLIEGDMRRLPFARGSFDLVVNLFTSFGYFEREEENDGVLAEIARVLKPGGRLAIDHINRPWMERTLEAESERTLEGGARVRERRRFDPRTRRVIKEVAWDEPGGGPTRRWHESVRVYEAAELESLLGAAGLRVIDRLGDFDANALGPDSPRMILIARRDADRPGGD